MKKILFLGDSITDMGRDYNRDDVFGLGMAYPFVVASELSRIDPLNYKVYNRGISGNRVVDLYARIKKDVWNLEPDYLGILIGINDIWHEIDIANGVDIERYEKVYRMLVEDTIKNVPGIKIALMEPFVLSGSATNNAKEKFDEIKDYAKVVKKIAKDYNLSFIPLQNKFDDYSNKYTPEAYLVDGVHPTIAGATLIADSWLEYFKEEIKK